VVGAMRVVNVALVQTHVLMRWSKNMGLHGCRTVWVQTHVFGPPQVTNHQVATFTDLPQQQHSLQHPLFNNSHSNLYKPVFYLHRSRKPIKLSELAIEVVIILFSGVIVASPVRIFCKCAKSCSSTTKLTFHRVATWTNE